MMLLNAIAFLIGDLLLQTQVSLPSTIVYLVLCHVMLLLLVCIYYYKKWRLWLGFFFSLLFGFTYSACFALMVMSWKLPNSMIKQTVTIEGTIASIPKIEKDGLRFLFDFTTLTMPDHKIVVKPTTVSLTWREPKQALIAGSQWRLQVQLKPIHGKQNPGSVDYEAWALAKGIRAQGHIIQTLANQLLHTVNPRYFLLRLRQIIYTKINNDVLPREKSPWLLALIIGERQGIAADDWQILRRTGTNHLMAIAGLHIGLVSGLIYMLVTYCWSRIYVLVLYLPAKVAAAISAAIVGIGYSALAGFSIPTMRACLMLILATSAIITNRFSNAKNVWALTLVLVLLINPLSVLEQSFFLSFFSIALIIYTMSGRLSVSGWWWKWGRVQWVLSLGLAPLTLWFFQETSLISMLANTIAIPWLGLTILPLALLASLLLFIVPSIALSLFYLVDKNLHLLWGFLSYMSHLPLSSWEMTIANGWQLYSAELGILILVSPLPIIFRYYGIIFILAILLNDTPKPQRGEVWFSILDVGQGLATVVQTKHHVLLYDVGMKLNEHYDMGKQIMLPYLKYLQVKKINTVVISHGDIDHRGGFDAVRENYPIKQIKTSAYMLLTDNRASLCQAGQAWQWDGVNFKFVAPIDYSRKANNNSCVLRIDNGQYSIMLPGDIEQATENAMLKYASQLFPVSIMLAPHHGSKSSGSKAFIQASHAQYVVYAVGYLNRYHFPHPNVDRLYQEIGAKRLNTSACGMIFFKLSKHDPIQVNSYRRDHNHYWSDDVAFCEE
jgi:competence protein ComEC